MNQDTRKDRRVKIVSLNVRYKSATVDEFIENHAHDVSRGGIYIKTGSPFPPGTLLKFEIRLASDQAVIAGVGRVVWKREAGTASGERPAGMGVKFIKIDEPSKAVIDKLVNTKAGRRQAPIESEAEMPATATTRPSAKPHTGAAGAQGQRSPPAGIARAPSPAQGHHDGPGHPHHPAPRERRAVEAGGRGGRPGRCAGSAREQRREGAGCSPRRNPTAEMPSKQEQTVMKQAAELLEEALREAGGSMEEIGHQPALLGLVAHAGRACPEQLAPGGVRPGTGGVAGARGQGPLTDRDEEAVDAAAGGEDAVRRAGDQGADPPTTRPRRERWWRAWRRRREGLRPSRRVGRKGRPRSRGPWSWPRPRPGCRPRRRAAAAARSSFCSCWWRRRRRRWSCTAIASSEAPTPRRPPRRRRPSRPSPRRRRAPRPAASRPRRKPPAPARSRRCRRARHPPPARLPCPARRRRRPPRRRRPVPPRSQGRTGVDRPGADPPADRGDRHRRHGDGHRHRHDQHDHHHDHRDRHRHCRAGAPAQAEARRRQPLLIDPHLAQDGDEAAQDGGGGTPHQLPVHRPSAPRERALAAPRRRPAAGPTKARATSPGLGCTSTPGASQPTQGEMVKPVPVNMPSSAPSTSTLAASMPSSSWASRSAAPRSEASSASSLPPGKATCPAWLRIEVGRRTSQTCASPSRSKRGTSTAAAVPALGGWRARAVRAPRTRRSGSRSVDSSSRRRHGAHLLVHHHGGAGAVSGPASTPCHPAAREGRSSRRASVRRWATGSRSHGCARGRTRRASTPCAARSRRRSTAPRARRAARRSPAHAGRSCRSRPRARSPSPLRRGPARLPRRFVRWSPWSWSRACRECGRCPRMVDFVVMRVAHAVLPGRDQRGVDGGLALPGHEHLVLDGDVDPLLAVDRPPWATPSAPARRPPRCPSASGRRRSRGRSRRRPCALARRACASSAARRSRPSSPACRRRNDRRAHRSARAQAKGRSSTDLRARPWKGDAVSGFTFVAGTRRRSVVTPKRRSNESSPVGKLPRKARPVWRRTRSAKTA